MKFMHTKKILAGATSAALAFTVLASGCGKVEKDEDSEKESSSLSIASALSSVTATLENAQKMISGNGDTAYSANMNVEFGAMATTLLGVELQPIDLVSTSKSKNGMFAQELALSYNGTQAVSMNLLFDNAQKTGYVQVPELSKGYIMANESDLNSLIADMGITTADVSGFLADAETTDMTAASAELAESIEKMIPEYVDFILEQLPEGKATDDLNETIGDVKVSLTAKEAELSDSQAIEIAIKVLEKAKTDEDLLALLDNAQVQEIFTEATGSAFDQTAYETQIQSLIDEMTSEKDTATGETITYTVYYDGKDIAGVSLPMDEGTLKCYTYADGNKFATMLSLLADGDTMEYRFSGTENDSKLNAAGTITYSDGTDTTTMNMEIQDLAVLDNGTFTGTVTASANIPAVGEVSMTATSNSTEKKTDLTAELSYSGQSVVKITFTGEETAASDITLPSSDVYSYSDDAQMQAYAETLDLEGLESNLQTLLGADLFGLLFNTSSDLMNDSTSAYAINDDTTIAS